MEAQTGKTSSSLSHVHERRSAAAPSAPTSVLASSSSTQGTLTYGEVAHRLQQHVERVVPEGATVVVVSKGDSTLLHFENRRAWHFPQREDGVYAGFYPPDSAAAVEHLESLQKKGAGYLVIPATAFWWMEQYADFARYLNIHHRAVLNDPAVCMIFALHGQVPQVRMSHVSQEAARTLVADESCRWLGDHIDLAHAADLLAMFDADYYYSQRPDLREQGVNALAHYMTADGKRTRARPNPLFDDDFYLKWHADVKPGTNPLVHYITSGREKGLYTSAVHRNLLNALLNERPRRHLMRGGWHKGIVLLFADGADRVEAQQMFEVAAKLRETHHLRPLLIFLRRQGLSDDLALQGNGVVLEDVRVACDIFRPSALHLLTTSLAALKPLFAIVSTQLVTDALKSVKVPFVLVPDYEEESVETCTSRILERVDREVALSAQIQAPKNNRPSTARKIFIPCCDWALSGVNSAIESIGQELIVRGYEVEILFTRGEKAVAGDPSRLPKIPYRFLERSRADIEATWEALIAELEMNAPCIVLTAYDFAANGIAPALSNDVGVVAWVQSDDRDYYEQAYRLGRYCNAVIAVSEHIKQQLTELNPLIGARTRVIHNSSVRESDIAQTARNSDEVRLIYTGRLVQYQKRILDVIELAESLDRLAVRYKITLAGEFSGQENTESLFRSRAAAHLADGRIVMAGRLNRNQILDELQKNDFFLLPSEFEGLPLSLIEAMACSCVPVVAQMDSGIPEAVMDGRNGLIMQGRNYDEWARRIVTHWRDRARMDDLSTNAREIVRQNFTVEHIGAQFAELFEEIGRELAAGSYQRPPCLNSGERHSSTGDVLAPPSQLILPGKDPDGSRSFLYCR